MSENLINQCGSAQVKVLLSSFVDSESVKSKAEDVFSEIDGVNSVKNGLEVRS